MDRYLYTSRGMRVWEMYIYTLADMTKKLTIAIPQHVSQPLMARVECSLA